MTAVLGSSQLVLLTLLLFAGLGALICRALEGRVLSSLSRVAPRERVRLLLAFAAAPGASAVLGTALCLVPWVASTFSPELDHCESHGGHSHLCFTHPPGAPGAAAWLLLSAAAVYGVLRLMKGARAIHRARRLVRSLRAMSLPRAELGIREVSSSTPICVAAGFLRPTVIVSSGFIAGLSRGELAAVLAHERAHVLKRDALRVALARVLAICHFPAVGSRIVAEIELASELDCDEQAARSVGDALLVASAIVKVGRLIAEARRLSPLGVVSFGARALDVRVRALVEERAAAARAPRLWLFVTALSLIGVVGSDPLHHATETVLSLFFR